MKVTALNMVPTIYPPPGSPGSPFGPGGPCGPITPPESPYRKKDSIQKFLHVQNVRQRELNKKKRLKGKEGADMIYQVYFAHHCVYTSALFFFKIIIWAFYHLFDIY